MFIDLINNINNLINDIPKYLLHDIEFDYQLYFNIINNDNIKNNKLNVFDYIDIVKYIHNIENALNKIQDDSIVTYIRLYFNNLKLILKEYSIKIQKEFILYFKNSNQNEIYNLFLLFDYIDITFKNEILSIFNEKINEIKHMYFIFKINYNYDNYFKKLSTLTKKSIGINPNIIKEYDFINNNDFDIKNIKLKKENSSLITSDDFYSVINNSINNHFKNIEHKIIKKKNHHYLKIDDILNIKKPEIFLYNYFNYYDILKNKPFDKNTKANIIINKSIFNIID